MPGNLSQPGASVARRLLAILAAFDSGHRRLSLTELAKSAELPVPTAHRLVGELVDWGALRRVETGEYVVGRRLWEIGLLASLQTDLREVASPFLHDLFGATHATVVLGVQDGLGVLYVDRVSGHASVPIVSAIGGVLPLHATGVGKVLLAYASSEVQESAFARLTRPTVYTVVHPGRLRRQLSRVRQEGYATTVEEMSLGACSVAVPIRRGGVISDPVVAALGVVVPSLKDVARLVAGLQVAANGIGRALEPPG